jgi:hypothetical protein
MIACIAIGRRSDSSHELLRSRSKARFPRLRLELRRGSQRLRHGDGVFLLRQGVDLPRYPPLTLEAFLERGQLVVKLDQKIAVDCRIKIHSLRDSRCNLSGCKTNQSQLTQLRPRYQCIDSNVGRFLIACDNVQPYLDGQKLTLRIGIQILSLTRALKMDNGTPNRLPVSKYPVASGGGLREKEIESTADLKPSHWNTVEVASIPAGLFLCGSGSACPTNLPRAERIQLVGPTLCEAGKDLAARRSVALQAYVATESCASN